MHIFLLKSSPDIRENPLHIENPCHWSAEDPSFDTFLISQKYYHTFRLLDPRPLLSESLCKQNRRKKRIFWKFFFQFIPSPLRVETHKLFPMWLSSKAYKWMSFGLKTSLLRSINIEIEFQKVNPFPHDPKFQRNFYSPPSPTSRLLSVARKLFRVCYATNVGRNISVRELQATNSYHNL